MVKDRRVPFNIAPQIPLVPISKEYWVSLSDPKLEEAWHLVGPTIQRNLRTTQADEQWKLYAIAFIEGMRMCLHGIEERSEDDESRSQELRTSKGSTPSVEVGGIQRMDSFPRIHYSRYPSEGDIRSIED